MNPWEVDWGSPDSPRPVNNPGNMRPPGATTGFQQFESAEQGLAAIDRQLELYGKRGINTLGGIIAKWSPPNENDTPTLIRNASGVLGVDPSAQLDMRDPTVRAKVREAIVRQEGGSNKAIKTDSGMPWRQNWDEQTQRSQVAQIPTPGPTAQIQAAPAGRGVGPELARQAGLFGRNVIQGGLGLAKLPGDLLGMAGDRFDIPALSRFSSSRAVDSLLDTLGLPQPETGTERVLSNVTQAVTGALTGQGLGGLMSRSASPVAAGVGEVMAARPSLQATSAVSGAGAAGLTREAGGGETAQTVAGLAGSLLPGLGSGVSQLRDYGRNQEKLTGEALHPGRFDVARAANEAGYKIPPHMFGEKAPGITAQGWGGKAQTAQKFSIQNQNVTNRLVRAELGIPDDVPLTSATMSKVRAQGGEAYRAIEQSGVTIRPDVGVRRAAAEIRAVEDQIAAMAPGADNTNSSVMRVADTLEALSDSSAPALVSLVKRWRNRATANYRNASGPSPAEGAGEAARAYDAGAGALEDLLQRNMIAAGKQDLLPALEKARAQIAKAHQVERALDNAGNVNASKLIAAAARGPATGNLKLIGDVAGQFEDAMKLPKRAGGYVPRSPIDWGLAGTVGTVGIANQHPVLGTLGAMVALSRPAARGYILSDTLQRKLAAPPVQGMTRINPAETFGPGLLNIGANPAAYGLLDLYR